MTYEAMGRLVPNEAVSVLERDDNGALVGAYKGYWNFKRGTVTLYPDYRNPFVSWRGGAAKKVVSDRVVRVRADARSSSSTASGPPSPILGKAKTKVVTNMTRQLKSLPIMGQEKIKF